MTTDIDTSALRAEHEAIGDRCAICAEIWPCPTIRVLDRLAAAEARATAAELRLEEAVRARNAGFSGWREGNTLAEQRTSQLETTEAQLAQARAALAKYGTHLHAWSQLDKEVEGCRKWWSPKHDCTCGLDAALAEQEVKG